MLNITTEMTKVLNTIENNSVNTDSLVRELDQLAWEQLSIDSSLPTRANAGLYYFSIVGEGWSVTLTGDPWNFFVNGRHYMSGNCRLNAAMYLLHSHGIFDVPDKYRIIWNGVVLRHY